MDRPEDRIKTNPLAVFNLVNGGGYQGITSVEDGKAAKADLQRKGSVDAPLINIVFLTGNE